MSFILNIFVYMVNFENFEYLSMKSKFQYISYLDQQYLVLNVIQFSI